MLRNSSREYAIWSNLFKGWCKINQLRYYFIWFCRRAEFFLWTGFKGSFLFTHFAKSSQPKLKFLLFMGPKVLNFLHGSYSFAEVMHDVFFKPVLTTASTQNTVVATWLHLSPMPEIQVQWQNRIFADFSKTIQSLWNGSLTDWDFLHLPFRIHKLLPVNLWHNSGCN